jgi:hypothetical protein
MRALSSCPFCCESTKNVCDPLSKKSHFAGNQFQSVRHLLLFFDPCLSLEQCTSSDRFFLPVTSTHPEFLHRCLSPISFSIIGLIFQTCIVWLYLTHGFGTLNNDPGAFSGIFSTVAGSFPAVVFLKNPASAHVLVSCRCVELRENHGPVKLPKQKLKALFHRKTQPLIPRPPSRSSPTLKKVHLYVLNNGKEEGFTYHGGRRC